MHLESRTGYRCACDLIHFYPYVTLNGLSVKQTPIQYLIHTC
jgi:hypothetical protein